MGSGKSTVGARLAKQLGWRFVDLDEKIEEAAGITIPEFFERHGEPAFRQLEADQLRGTLGRAAKRQEPTIVALGEAPTRKPSRRRRRPATHGSHQPLSDFGQLNQQFKASFTGALTDVDYQWTGQRYDSVTGNCTCSTATTIRLWASSCSAIPLVTPAATTVCFRGRRPIQNVDPSGLDVELLVNGEWKPFNDAVKLVSFLKNNESNISGVKLLGHGEFTTAEGKDFTHTPYLQ